MAVQLKLVPQRDMEDLRDTNGNDELAAKNWFEDRMRRMTAEGVFTEVVDLTLALAKEFKLHNNKNRQMRPAKLKQLQDDIICDRWKFNGEPFIVAETGNLNDGQHRNEAVINTGKTIRTLIVFGLPEDTRDTIDNGAARTPGDHLAIEGIQYSHECASIARFVLAFERGKLRKLGEMNRVTATEIVDRVIADKEIQSAAIFSKSGYNKSNPIAPPSVIGFCLYMFGKKDGKIAKDFMQSVVTGIGLQATDPAYVVREKLLSMDRPLREHRADYLFKGWNAFRQNKKITTLARPTNELPAIS